MLRWVNAWFYRRCTDLNIKDFEHLVKSKEKWYCNVCLHMDNQISTCVWRWEIESDQLMMEELNKQLCVKMENLNLMLKTINDDLVKSRKKIIELHNKNSVLENHVLKKEEII